MQLYNVPRGSKIRVIDDIKVPPAAPPIQKGEILTFYAIDGMYSTCKNSKGRWVHLVAWAEVEVIQDDESRSCTFESNHDDLFPH